MIRYWRRKRRRKRKPGAIAQRQWPFVFYTPDKRRVENQHCDS